MQISFELLMPSVGSWDGKWSGAGKCYAVVRSFRKDQPKLGYYHYNFGDGWAAGVSVREITAPAATKLKKMSAGFCGYEWMIDSIVKHGKIIA